jgi:uncharacterized membrane protein YeaQ/YmgE (transglycosylase-associated protein family)
MEGGGMGIIATLIIGVIAGFIAEKVMNRNHGLLTNLLVGLGGALLGGLLASILNIGVDGWIESIIFATIGAILLLFLLGLVKRGAR